MEEELDSSEEGEVSNEEATIESTAFQQHEHMADLFTTSCLDELDYDESVDESENDDHAHLPSHWELQVRRESEQVVEDVDAEEGEIMSGEEEAKRSPHRSKPVSNKQEVSPHSPVLSPSQSESKKSQAPSPPPSTFPNQWEKSASICRHFLQGRCSWGENCRFLHEGIPDDVKTTPPRVPRIHRSHSPVDFSSQSHPPHLHPSPHLPHLHPSPRPPNMAASPFKPRGYGMPPVMNEFGRGPPPFASEMIPGGGHFPPHDFPPHAFGRPHPPWPPPPPAFHGQPVAGVGPHKEEENDGWLRLRPIIPGWDSDEDQPIDQATQLKRKKDLLDSWETESNDDKPSKKKKRKKNKRSKSPQEVTTLLENEWVDPWARKPSKSKSEESKGGRGSDDAEEKKKKKKKSKKNKKDKELPSQKKENEKLPEKTSMSLRSNEEEDVITPENTSPLSGGWMEERSQHGKSESYQTSAGWTRDISPDFDVLVGFDEEGGVSSTLHAFPHSSQREAESRTSRERKKSGKKHSPSWSDIMSSRQDQLLQELEKVNRSLERKKSKRHHKH